jgi:hypothetical protein
MKEAIAPRTNSLAVVELAAKVKDGGTISGTGMAQL